MMEEINLGPELKLNHFKARNVLGIDYGKKVIGLAYYCHGNDLQPFPIDKIVNLDQSKSFQLIKKLIKQENIEIVIFGIPLLLDGKGTSTTKEMLLVGNCLKNELPSNIEFYFQDETLSTFEAKERMKNSPRYNFKIDMKLIDSLSAAIIIESFFSKLN